MARESKSGNCYILQPAASALEFTAAMFGADYWRDRPGFGAVSGGRGGSCLIEVDGRRAILRRYHRGGAVSSLSNDRYLWVGKNLSRPWREWSILERALAAQLPVPEPIAACVCRDGPWYRAALITAFLDDTEMLTRRIEREPLPRDCWVRLGALFRLMHGECIRHADLTSDNVLIDSRDHFYLVDFDRARLMKKVDDWQWRPLYRFQRSIFKRDQRKRLHFGEADWEALMHGYQSGAAATD